MQDFDYADTATPPATEQEFLMENLCVKKGKEPGGYTPPATRSASKRWKRINEQSMMLRLDEMHVIKKQNAQMSKEAARKIIRKIPVEVLAKEWLSKEDATVDMRAYLVDHVLPTLILGIERLLKEVDEKGLSATNRFEPEFNPINFLAQYLMRNNPRFSNFAEASPYVRGLREVSEEIKQELFTFEDNRLARIKAEARRKRNEREKQEQLLREEKERRQQQLITQFHEWNVPTDNNRVELSLLQNALRSFAEIAEQLPDELREVAKFGHPLEPTDETGRTLAVKEFAQYISLFVEDLPIEVFEQFMVHMSKCAAAHRAAAERENRRIILTNLFLLCDHGGLGLLDRHRILTLFEQYWDLLKGTTAPKGTLRNPRRWPVVEVEEVDDTMFNAWEEEEDGGLTEAEHEVATHALEEINKALEKDAEAAVIKDKAAREQWKMEQLLEKSEGYQNRLYKYSGTDFLTLTQYPLTDTMEAPKSELMPQEKPYQILTHDHDLYANCITKTADEREKNRRTKLGLASSDEFLFEVSDEVPTDTRKSHDFSGGGGLTHSVSMAKKDQLNHVPRHDINTNAGMKGGDSFAHSSAKTGAKDVNGPFKDTNNAGSHDNNTNYTIERSQHDCRADMRKKNVKIQNEAGMGRVQSQWELKDANSQMPGPSQAKEDSSEESESEESEESEEEPANKNNNTSGGKESSIEEDTTSKSKLSDESDEEEKISSQSSRVMKKVRFLKEDDNDDDDEEEEEEEEESISKPKKKIRRVPKFVSRTYMDASTSLGGRISRWVSPYQRLPPIGLHRYLGGPGLGTEVEQESQGEVAGTADGESEKSPAEGGGEEIATAEGTEQSETAGSQEDAPADEKKEEVDGEVKKEEEEKVEEAEEKKDEQKKDEGEQSGESSEQEKAVGVTATDEDGVTSGEQAAGTNDDVTIAEPASGDVAVTSNEADKELAAQGSQEKDKDESTAAEELDVDITGEIAESQTKSALKRADPATGATATGRVSVTFAGNTAFDRERTGITTHSRSQSQMSAFDESILNVSQFVQLVETFLGHHPSNITFQQLVEFVKDGYEETDDEKTERLVKARKEAISAKRKMMMDNLFEKWDNDGSGYLEMDDVLEVMMAFKDGQEINTIKKAQSELRKMAKYQDQRLSKREFRQFIELIIEELPGSESFDVFVEFLTNSVERSYAERIRGEARKKWLHQIIAASQISGTSMDPIYKAVFQALYKDAETHGGEKRISASIGLLEKNKIEPHRGDLLLRYAACTPEDCQYMLGKALYKNMKGVSFQAVEQGKPVHVPRVSTHGMVYFWNYDRLSDERDGSFIVVPLKDIQKRVFGVLGIDTLVDPHKKAIFITHEIQFFQGVAKSFSIAYHTVDIRRKLLRITESAISWIQRRCPHIAEISVYLVEPNTKEEGEPVLRKMMTTDKKGTAQQVTEVIRLERKDNLFRDYIFKCIDNSETVVADAYGERHTASPLRDNNGKAVGVIDISIGFMKTLPTHENKECQRMLRLLQKAYKEITRVAKGDDMEQVLEAEQDENTRMDIMFDRLMLQELRENVSRLDPQSFAELKSYYEPPRIVIDILRATLAIFKVDMVGEGELDDWNVMKSCINNDLIQQIKSYDPTITANLIDTEKVERYLKATFNVPHGEVAKYGSIPAQQLYNWVFVCLSLIEHTRKMRESAEGNVLVSAEEGKGKDQPSSRPHSSKSKTP